jgi:hypothetical protein
MARFVGQADRPGERTPGSSYLHVTVNAADMQEGPRQGIATLTIAWGRRGPTLASDNEEQGREEYTRFGADVEQAIESVRDAALGEQKGESRRYVETAASRAILAVVEERDFWRHASDVATAFVNEWKDNPPESRAAMREAVRAVTLTDRQADAVMELVGAIIAKNVAEAMSQQEGSSS